MTRNSSNGYYKENNNLCILYTSLCNTNKHNTNLLGWILMGPKIGPLHPSLSLPTKGGLVKCQLLSPVGGWLFASPCPMSNCEDWLSAYSAHISYAYANRFFFSFE